MYCEEDFKTKKAFKEAVKNGRKLKLFQPGIGQPPQSNGSYAVEGPWYPRPHTWYASVKLDADCNVISVK